MNQEVIKRSVHWVLGLCTCVCEMRRDRNIYISMSWLGYVGLAELIADINVTEFVKLTMYILLLYQGNTKEGD